MFETAELDHVVATETYDAELPKLRTQLLQAQLALRDRPFPLLLVVAGSDAAGKGELVHRLNEWLDPRGVETHAFWNESDEERERPRYWRFWRALPARGRIGIFIGSWYTQPVLDRAMRAIKNGRFDVELDRITAFEQMLTQDGAVIVKLWLHLPKREQKKRLKQLEKDGRLAPEDWKHHKMYHRFLKVAERAIRRTDVPPSSWHVVEATDRRYLELTSGRIVLDALQKAVDGTSKRRAPARRTKEAASKAVPADDSVLAHVDLTQSLASTEYRKRLDVLQTELGKLAWKAQRLGRSTVLAFEGWDAAGKGSAIRRVTQALDPRLYHVAATAAPSDEERAHHYLWRFWRRLPRAGFITLFDRSWYGRVLVERVEGFASPEEWGRAYHEINEFEEQLADRGILVLKFWIHISQDEQLRRFRQREKVAYKRYKITDDDWRNRKKWPAYQQAVEDMIAKCSTEFAPWTIVAGNDKRFARVQILETIVDRLSGIL